MIISSDEENLECMYSRWEYRLVTASLESNLATKTFKMAMLWLRNSNLGNCDGTSTSNGPNVFVPPVAMPFGNVLWKELWARPSSCTLAYGTDVSLTQAQTGEKSMLLLQLCDFCVNEAGRLEDETSRSPRAMHQLIADAWVSLTYIHGFQPRAKRLPGPNCSPVGLNKYLLFYATRLWDGLSHSKS